MSKLYLVYGSIVLILLAAGEYRGYSFNRVYEL